MVELKQRILTSLSRIGDRNTYQIAVVSVSDSHEILPVPLHCLFDSFDDPQAPVKRESIRLLSFLCLSYSDLTSSQLAKIISHIVKRLKDADNGVRDACRNAIRSRWWGSLLSPCSRLWQSRTKAYSLVPRFVWRSAIKLINKLKLQKSAVEKQLQSTISSSRNGLLNREAPTLRRRQREEKEESRNRWRHG